jgi:WD40 repeat protein
MKRFALYSRTPIELAPLQVYSSALVFAPSKSLVRKQFVKQFFQWVKSLPQVNNDWSACLQTLEGHGDMVWSVAFSHDSARLASASYDSTVKIWDAHSGACLQTLEGHDNRVGSVAFSHDSARLASTSYDRTVKIWDAHSGACLQTLKGHSGWVNSVAFSHDSARLASTSYDSTVKIWDAHSGACLQTLEGHDHMVNMVGFETQQPLYQCIGLSSDQTWITRNAQNWLWLPLEYRPSCSTVSGRCLGVGTRSGMVWTFVVLVDTVC